MRHLLPAALPEVEQWAASVGPLSLFLDFDAAMAAAARAPGPTASRAALLASLAEMCHTRCIAVTLFSGRSLSELRRLVDIDGVVFAANHGMEIEGPGLIFVDPAAWVCRDTIKTLESKLQVALGRYSGIRIENRGLTLSVRGAEQEADAIRKSTLKAMEEFSGPLMFRRKGAGGEILPRSAWTKGTAARWIHARLGVHTTDSLYVGTDVSDESAFEALAEGVTVRAGLTAVTRARFLLHSVAELPVLIGLLADLTRPECW